MNYYFVIPGMLLAGFIGMLIGEYRMGRCADRHIRWYVKKINDLTQEKEALFVLLKK